MRRCGEQTNELHISRRERKGKEEREGTGGQREGGEMEQEWRDDDRDREMSRGEVEKERRRGEEEE